MRNFKKRISFLIPFCLLVLVTVAQKKAKESPLVISINAYTFHELLTAKDSRNNEQVYNYFNLLDWCASNHVKALDPTAYYFPGYPEVPSDEYLKKFRDKAKSLGIAISGTGIRNNFASPDQEVREESLELAKKWIVAASKLGAPVLRVFSGEMPKGYEGRWKEVADRMIPYFRELAVHGEKYGVKIGIQNHGDMLQTAEQCEYILKAVNSKWVGLVLDIGSFRTPDPYQDIAAMVPYAINWQVKSSPFSPGGAKTDMNKLVKIIKDGGYKGYLPVESLMVKGVSYDPFEEVQRMIRELELAIKEVYR
jgi:sugar phosphate isomerase/epimerase